MINNHSSKARGVVFGVALLFMVAMVAVIFMQFRSGEADIRAKADVPEPCGGRSDRTRFCRVRNKPGEQTQTCSKRDPNAVGGYTWGKWGPCIPD